MTRWPRPRCRITVRYSRVLWGVTAKMPMATSNWPDGHDQKERKTATGRVWGDARPIHCKQYLSWILEYDKLTVLFGKHTLHEGARTVSSLVGPPARPQPYWGHNHAVFPWNRPFPFPFAKEDS